MVGVWPSLVHNLSPLNWTTLALVHAGVLLSFVALYARALKGQLPQPGEILLAAGLVLMTWGFDFSLVSKIGGR